MSPGSNLLDVWMLKFFFVLQILGLWLKNTGSRFFLAFWHVWTCMNIRGHETYNSVQCVIMKPTCIAAGVVFPKRTASLAKAIFCLTYIHIYYYIFSRIHMCIWMFYLYNRYMCNKSMFHFYSLGIFWSRRSLAKAPTFVHQWDVGLSRRVVAWGRDEKTQPGWGMVI